jgi:hypothetical protein
MDPFSKQVNTAAKIWEAITGNFELVCHLVWFSKERRIRLYCVFCRATRRKRR